jgi:DNA ligase-associated metallophosphoesterase
LIRLLGQILFFKAERLIIVGDLTHSIANRELDLFRKWRRDFSSLDVHLAKGNHDILDNKWYQEADIHVHNDPYKLGNFIFVHDARKPKLEVPSGEYVFCGHVHPAVHIKGKGKQSLKFPCFYFTNTYCILPAFSRFSGTYKIEAKTDEKIFAVVEKEIIQIKSKK